MLGVLGGLFNDLVNLFKAQGGQLNTQTPGGDDHCSHPPPRAAAA